MTSSRWEVRPGTGPVLATAIHAGHGLRDSLKATTRLTPQERRREEDPLTEVFASVGDHLFVSRTSRFEVDLNRPPEQAVYRESGDAWGLDLWRAPLSEREVDDSLRAHSEFYELMTDWIESLVDTHGHILLLDVHSFNHRRESADDPASQDTSPDIDLGVTTADRNRFCGLIDTLASELKNSTVAGRPVDVRENVRFPDGGHFPEWVYANYSDTVCTITLEYKKIFMDEWSGTADLAILEELRAGLARAVDAVRLELS